MLKRRIGALIGAFALMFGALLVVAAPASAATPHQFQLPYEVSFSESTCTGVITVTLENNTHGRIAIGLVFSINGDEVTVDPDSTETVDVVYPNSLDIDVELVGVYLPGGSPAPVTADALEKMSANSNPDAKELSIPKLETEWHAEWVRPDGCWAVTVTSLCDGNLSVEVQNTAPAPGEFIIQPDTTESTKILVAGNAKFTATYDASTVTITLEEKVTTYNWKDPGDCVIPTPTPTPSTPDVPGGQAPDLPVTGASLTSGMIWSSTVLGVALLAGVVGGVLAWRRRRSQQTTA